ncbi:hypothetical protein ACIRRA_44840 [Nocardia sp. NPDC101769]|uniref:hypothetical protein n=1 Tax=Nocardia sp. NPDC101769 TaxID=3364333 RepID=UPI0037F49425
MAGEFARLDRIDDPAVLNMYIQDLVQRDLGKPLRDLQKGLTALKLKPARAVLGLKSLELPAVAALAAHELALPPWAGAGGAIAVQAISTLRTARAEAKQ